MDAYLLEKLEAAPQWDNPDWCDEQAWTLNKLTRRTQTLVVAQLYAQRVITSNCLHIELVTTARAILIGHLLNGDSCRWPQHPDNYLSPLHPVMAFGVAHKILYARQAPDDCKRRAEAEQDVIKTLRFSKLPPEKCDRLLAEHEASPKIETEETLWMLPA